MATPPQYTVEFFVELGFTPREAESFVANWNRQAPQTEAEIRAGLEWERSAREELAAQRLFNEPQARK